MKNKLFNCLLPLLVLIMLVLSSCDFLTAPQKPQDLRAKETRSWIKVSWSKLSDNNPDGYNIYCSSEDDKPQSPIGSVGMDTTEFYIDSLKPDHDYYIWVEAYNRFKKSEPVKGKFRTDTKWKLIPEELKNLYPETSEAVPEGMKLYWHDEFNDLRLDLNKWTTNYVCRGTFYNDDILNWFRTKEMMPQPVYTLNGKTMDIFTNDTLPETHKEGARRISSIQTYDWKRDELLVDNRRGGYFEIYALRDAEKDAKKVNTAFWFSAVGPDLRRYSEIGSVREGIKGLRPSGMVFEIDICEYLTTEIVLHGKIDKNDIFRGNIGHFILRKAKENRGKWMRYGMLWTPSSLHFYIDGKLEAEWTDLNEIRSPHYPMTIFLGTYAFGEANFEVDYIRYYRWDISGKNELPNPGFEYSEQIFPWTGEGVVSKVEKKTGSSCVAIKPGKEINQYVYLNNSKDYELTFWSKGSKVETVVENIVPVKGIAKNSTKLLAATTQDYDLNSLCFNSGEEFEDHMSTVKVKFKNVGKSTLYIDDIEVAKVN